MDIKTLQDKIQETMRIANEDLTTFDPQIRPAMEGRQRSAQSELRGLELQYRNRVVEGIVLISVSGEFAADFAAIASDKFKTLSFDYLAPVERIAKSVLSRGGRDMYDTHEHWMVMDELNQIKLNYSMSHIPPLHAKMGTGTPLREALKDLFDATYSGSLYSAILRGDIGKAALEAGFVGKTLPVVIYNYNVPVDLSMLKEPIANISVTKKPTEASVKLELVKIKKALKANPMTQNEKE